MSSNPLTIIPDHGAPRQKCSVLRGRLMLATAWRDGEEIIVKHLTPIQTLKGLGEVIEAVTGWAEQ